MALASAKIIADGYDRVAEKYLAWADGSPGRAHLLGRLGWHLPAKAAVLELGCGAGNPVARALSERGHQVTGIDLSQKQISLARRNAPEASFDCADMVTYRAAPESLDAVVAVFSLGHVPANQHGPLFRRIADWLQPGGLFFASLCESDNPGAVEAGWLGVDMFFSHPDLATSRQLIAGVGLRELECVHIVEPEDNDTVFSWIIARKEAADS
jgi:cyclopropane fatty-acyl-phospholipid synthase-like methyltransferase